MQQNIVLESWNKSVYRRRGQLADLWKRDITVDVIQERRNGLRRLNDIYDECHCGFMAGPDLGVFRPFGRTGPPQSYVLHIQKSILYSSKHIFLHYCPSSYTCIRPIPIEDIITEQRKVKRPERKQGPDRGHTFV